MSRSAVQRPRRMRAALMAASLVLLVFFALRMDWKPVFAAMGQAKVPWILGALAVGAGSIALRALRLAILADAPRRFPAAFWSYALGYLGALFLPLGSGEMVRVVALQRMTGLAWVRAATAGVVDRSFDLLGMAVVLALLLGQGVAGNLRTGPLVALAAILTLLLVGLITIVLGGHGLRRLLARVDPGGTRPRIQAFLGRYDEVHDQLLPLRRPARLAQVAAVQALVLAGDTAAVWIILLAFPFGHGLGILAPLRLNLFLMFAAALPLLPGSLGTHQVACVLALRPEGIAQAQALAFSLVAQGSAALWLIFQGLVALLRAPAHILSKPDGDSLVAPALARKEQP